MKFKYCRFQKEIILRCVRWYLAYPLSLRHIEEMMLERGICVDHSTINRWVLKYSQLLEAEARKRLKSVGSSWRLDETYIKVKGKWKYLYRAVDKSGQSIDFLFTAKRDKNAARRFLAKAIKNCGVPHKINIDKSGTNQAAIKSYNQDNKTKIEIRQKKYLNNIVEQDHRAVKRITRPMMGFKSFSSAKKTLAGIELIHMLRKGQMAQNSNLPLHQQFDSLAA
ncbi:MAG: IS6 family transposase [Myxococcales bacterium]|nr:IS6 family transposase [Myxococcales bacterium]USN51896.1 MAG: IS6 family transposase [Myxococcales bacterium]